jgi:hypothetical protein
MLVVIGRDWLADPTGDRTSGLWNHDDSIRIEITRALESHKMVIPVLVGGAPMPDAEALPTEIAYLATRQAYELSDKWWNEALHDLYRALETNGNLTAAPANAGVAPSNAIVIGNVDGGSQVAIGSNITQVSKVERAVPGRVEPASKPSSEPTSEPAPEREFAPASSQLVFISHADEDRDFVETAVKKLEQAGLSCWVSYRDIPAGESSWAGSIVDAIAKCKVMVIILTQYSAASKQVLREITIADDENIGFIPFRLDETPLPGRLKYFFSSAQQLNAGGLDSAKALDLLTTAVRKRLINQMDSSS